MLEQIFSQFEISAVMHFAAFIEVSESVQTPLRYYRNNFCCTENLLSAMETVGVEKFVFSSTAAVYGIPEEIPITEDSPTEPINPYGQTKLAVEKMCHYQSRTEKPPLSAFVPPGHAYTDNPDSSAHRPGALDAGFHTRCRWGVAGVYFHSNRPHPAPWGTLRVRMTYVSAAVLVASRLPKPEERR